MKCGSLTVWNGLSTPIICDNTYLFYLLLTCNEIKSKPEYMDKLRINPSMETKSMHDSEGCSFMRETNLEY